MLDRPWVLVERSSETKAKDGGSQAFRETMAPVGPAVKVEQEVPAEADTFMFSTREDHLTLDGKYWHRT